MGDVVNAGRSLPQGLVTVVIKRHVADADFRKSGTTMMESLPRSFVKRLKTREAVVFVNRARTMVRVGFRSSRASSGVTWVEHRYAPGHYFTPYTLQDIAHEHLNLHFDGRKTFAEWYAEQS